MIEHGAAEVNGTRLHYVTAGEGPLVLLIHGFPEFWYSWRHQIPVLAERFRIVAPDLRGYNQNPKPTLVSAYGTEELCLDIVGLVDHFGESRASVVGHDWGGAVAWATAGRHPDRVDRLAVLDCPHPRVFAHHLRNNLQQLRRSWYILFFQIRWLPEYLILRDARSMMARILRGTAFNREAFSQDDLDRYTEAITQPGALTAALNYYRAAGRGFLTGKPKAVPRIPQPTLVLWGENDKALGTEMAYDSRRMVDGPLEVEVLPRCGHWIQQERPGEVNRRLLSFLSG